MFSSIFLKTLRDYRVAILGWGVGMGLVITSPMASLASLISTPAQRVALAKLAAQFAWAADPVAAGTIGGYATFKIGIFVFLVCVWPGRAFKADFTLVDGLLFGLDLTLICMVFGGVALLISQFTHERGPAASATGFLLVVFIVIDMVHRVVPNTEWFSRFSPIYYYNLSKPLIPSFGTSAGGLLVLFGLAVVLTAAGIWLFVRRDAGDVVRIPLIPVRPALTSRALPAGDWSLRSIYARSLGMIAFPTFWWTLLIAGFAAWMVVVVQQMVSRLNDILNSVGSGSPALTILKNIGGGSTGLNAIFLGAMFEILPVLLMAFAVTQVNRWASDADEGRLEIILSTPQSRARVLLGRFAALATATVIVGVVTLAASAIAAQAAGVKLDSTNLAEASLGMIPLGLLIAAIGYLAAGWLRTAADTGLLSFVLAAWFFISFVGPDLKWPDATLRLSAFYYYGTPLTHGLQLANIAVVVAVGAAALALGVLRFARKDIAT